MPREEGSQERVFYGGTTKEEILDRSNDRIGIHHWAQEGITGIVNLLQKSNMKLMLTHCNAGRGVLIDYASWAEKRGITYSTFSLHTIKLSDILAIAEECNITFQRGDILLVRIGVIKEWEHSMDVQAKKAYAATTSPQHAGVEGTMDVLKWVWNTGFAAVAGDAISWEVSDCTKWVVFQLLTGLLQVYPPPSGTVLMHEYMLAGWGMPIGMLSIILGLHQLTVQANCLTWRNWRKRARS